MIVRVLFACLLMGVPAYADDFTPYVQSFTVSSSSVGSEIFAGFSNGAYVSASGSIGIARLNNCSQLTSYYGTLPLAADTAVSLSARVDSNGKWCGILKSGSTPVTGGANIW